MHLYVSTNTKRLFQIIDLLFETNEVIRILWQTTWAITEE